MVERALQRGLFQLQLVELLRVHRGLVRLVPDAEHLVALRQIVVRDGRGEPVGEFILKAVAVVALRLQLFPVQLRKLLDGVDIVIGIAAGSKLELPRVQRLQLLLLVLGQAAQAQRTAALRSVGADGLDGPLDIARACRVEIDLPAAPGRVLRQMIADAAQLPKIIGPEIHTAECIFRAGILAVFQNFMRPYAVGGLCLVERDHKKSRLLSFRRIVFDSLSV